MKNNFKKANLHLFLSIKYYGVFLILFVKTIQQNTARPFRFLATHFIFAFVFYLSASCSTSSPVKEVSQATKLDKIIKNIEPYRPVDDGYVAKPLWEQLIYGEISQEEYDKKMKAFQKFAKKQEKNKKFRVISNIPVLNGTQKSSHQGSIRDRGFKANASYFTVYYLPGSKGLSSHEFLKIKEISRTHQKITLQETLDPVGDSRMNQLVSIFQGLGFNKNNIEILPSIQSDSSMRWYQKRTITINKSRKI